MPNEKGLLTALIDNYTNLQRIKSAVDKDKEIDYQVKALKVKLESFGIVTTDLDL